MTDPQASGPYRRRLGRFNHWLLKLIRAFPDRTVVSACNVCVTIGDLLSAHRVSATAHDWQASTPRASLRFRPFMDIEDEGYRVYQDVSVTRS